MAEASLGYTASNLFDLPSQFNPQRSTTRVTRERDLNLSSIGDVACESDPFNITTTYTCDYEYCGTALVTDLAAHTNADLLTEFGNVRDSKLVDSGEFTFGNKIQPEISLAGHNHAVEPHLVDVQRNFDISGIIPDAGGVGVPAITGITVAATNAVHSAVFSVSHEHMDTEDGSGDHFSGENRTCLVSLTLSGVGPASGITVGGDWKIDEPEDEDGNTDPDAFSVTCHQYVDAN